MRKQGLGESEMNILIGPMWRYFMLGVFLTALSTRAGAQVKRPVVLRGDILDLKVVPPACCVVTSLDLVKGIVGGRETSTGYTFKFIVFPPGHMTPQDSASLIRHIAVGQKVWASLQGKGVEVIYGKLCCAIIEESDH
jgi:hypothetical protein